jgi:hypothetical protein
VSNQFDDHNADQSKLNLFKQLIYYFRRHVHSIKNEKYLPCALVGTVIIYYFCSVWIFSVNLPSWDDYDAILNFLNNYIGKNDFSKLSLLFAQENEHRIIFCRLVSVLYFYLFKTINFKALNCIGDLSLLGIFLLLINTVDKNLENKYWSFLLIGLLLFSHGFWETSYMAMGALSNLWVLFFALLALHFLSKENFFWSIVFAVLSTFTSGGGICVFVAGSFMCVFQKRYKRLMIWIFAMAMALSLYLYHYVKPVQHPDLEFAFYHPIQSAFCLFSSLGSDLGLLILLAIPEESVSGLLSGAWLGLFIFSQIFYLTIKKYYRINPRVYFFLVYLLTLSSTIVLARSGFGISSGLNSRYVIISVLYLICAYISLLDMKYFKNKKRVFLCALACMALNGSWFLMLYTNHGNSLMTTNSLFVDNFDNRDLKKPDFPDQSRAWSYLNESKTKGIYDFSKEVAALKR